MQPRGDVRPAGNELFPNPIALAETYSREKEA
jgi:hypothetical protein